MSEQALHFSSVEIDSTTHCRPATNMWGVSLAVSALFHFTVLAVLTSTWLPLDFLAVNSPAALAWRPEIVVRWEADDQAGSSEPVMLSLVSDEDLQAVTIDADEIFAAAMAMSEPELADLYPPMQESPLAGLGDMLESIRRDAEERDPEEQLARLQQLSGRLERISSERSVDDVLGVLSKSLGTDRRATQPRADAAEGPFDYATAQLHDVNRAVEADGQVRYVSILVDAAGRQMTAEMGQAEGERAFRVMQLLKSNPLAERIYRGLVMSLLDGVLKDRRQSSETTERRPNAEPGIEN